VAHIDERCRVAKDERAAVRRNPNPTFFFDGPERGAFYINSPSSALVPGALSFVNPGQLPPEWTPFSGRFTF